MVNFILTISYLGIGLVLRRVPKFPKDSAGVLNHFVIYVSLPALILLKVPSLGLGKDLLVPVLLPWLMLLISAALVLLGARIFSWRQGVVGVLLLMIPLGNTSFLGIPMVTAFFGEVGVPFALLYDQFGSFIALSTYGTMILALYGGEGNPSVREVVLKIITFPPFIALVAALLFLRGSSYPQALEVLLTSLANTLVPVVMIAVGLQLAFRFSSGTFGPFVYGLLIKLVIAPLSALLICAAFGLEGLPVKVAIFEAGMPPMVSAGALAISAGMSPELTAAFVGFGIVASFITLPILAGVLVP
jgi:predicted permease